MTPSKLRCGYHIWKLPHLRVCALAALSYLLTYGNGVFDVRAKVADADARFCAKRNDARGIANETELDVVQGVGAKGASRYDVRIGGGGGQGKVDLVREVA